jgi:AcrR family transcriptional regulator
MATEKKKGELKPATERGETTRARLVEAAYGLFLRNGFHGTSLRVIAQATGVAVGGIYNHFRDKDEIFGAVLDAYHPYHTLAPAVLAIEGDTVEDYLRQLARVLYAGLTDAKSQLLPLIFIELVEFQGAHMRQLFGRAAPAVWKYADERLKTLRGRLRPYSLPLILRAFISLLIGMVLTDMVLKDTPLFKPLKINWLEGVMDIFLHGILEPKA